MYLANWVFVHYNEAKAKGPQIDWRCLINVGFAEKILFIAAKSDLKVCVHVKFVVESSLWTT